METYGDVKIVFQSNRGRLYGKLVGKTINTDNGHRKESQEHLGRVVDKEQLIFWNRKRGMFRYDPLKAAYLPVPESFSPEWKDDGRKKKKRLLDFGDTYFVSELLKKIHYDEVIDAIPYPNKDRKFRRSRTNILFSVGQHLHDSRTKTSAIGKKCSMDDGQIFRALWL